MHYAIYLLSTTLTFDINIRCCSSDSAKIIKIPVFTVRNKDLRRQSRVLDVGTTTKKLKWSGQDMYKGLMMEEGQNRLWTGFQETGSGENEDN